ncbi:hypothetical protein ABIA39_001510 [Nocardia sp. GAS34]|uniref:hypothetical protein n=1 Tax=unclassified Nocardia TaxID=2637762 RepID=UPI003D224854
MDGPADYAELDGQQRLPFPGRGLHTQLLDLLGGEGRVVGSEGVASVLVGQPTSPDGTGGSGHENVSAGGGHVPPADQGAR